MGFLLAQLSVVLVQPTVHKTTCSEPDKSWYYLLLSSSHFLKTIYQDKIRNTSSIQNISNISNISGLSLTEWLLTLAVHIPVQKKVIESKIQINSQLKWLKTSRLFRPVVLMEEVGCRLLTSGRTTPKSEYWGTRSQEECLGNQHRHRPEGRQDQEGGRGQALLLHGPEGRARWGIGGLPDQAEEGVRLAPKLWESCILTPGPL